jgi:hypothetical protein
MLRGMKDLDVAFISPWLHRSVLRGGFTLDAKRLCQLPSHRRRAGPRVQAGCTVPRQGERLPL